MHRGAATRRRDGRLVGRHPGAPLHAADLRVLRARPASAACAVHRLLVDGGSRARRGVRPRRRGHVHRGAPGTRAGGCRAVHDRPGPARRGTARAVHPRRAGLADRRPGPCRLARPRRRPGAAGSVPPLDGGYPWTSRSPRSSGLPRPAPHVRRPGDHPGRAGVGAVRAVPDGDRAGDGRDGAVRHHRAGTVRRPRPRPGLVRAGVRGDSPAAGWASPASSAATPWPAG